MATKTADEHTEVGPEDIPAPGWRAVLRRTVKEFQNDGVTDWAAALTYYSVLALFPGLIVLVALVGLFGQYPQTTDNLIQILSDIGVNTKSVHLRGTINSLVTNKGGAGALLGFGLVGALWSASAYVGAFMRASNAIFDIPEGRPVWKLRPLQIAVTLTITVLFALMLIGLVVSGPLAEAIGKKIGLGGTAVTVWGIAKWPAMAFMASFMLAILYYAAPNARLPKIRWISPGATVALVVWVIVSFGFFFYASHFPNDKTYGALGGAITLLVWMWLTNVAILFGQELNAEVERGREIAAGEPAIDDIQLPMRDRPKKDPRRAAADISRKAVETEGNGGAKHDEAVDHLSSSAVAEDRAGRPR